MHISERTRCPGHSPNPVATRFRWVRKRFRCVAVPAIIERVRCRRVVVAVAVLSVLSACTWGGDKKTAPPLPINPTPTAPGQVVVLAGNGEQKNPVNGAYATRSPVYASGAIAAAPDGSIFTFADNGQDRALVRIGRDGKVSVFSGRASGVDRQVLAATSTHVWWLGTGDSSVLFRYSLDGTKEESFFGPSGSGPKNLTFVGASGRAVPEAQGRALVKRWRPSAMAVRDDGVPIVATEDGSLYEALGQGKVRPWNPPGYTEAIRKARTRQGASGPAPSELSPSVIIPGRNGELVIVGIGIIHVPRRGGVQTTSFRVPDDVLWTWGGGVTLDDDSLLLVDTGVGRLLRIGSDGSMFRVPAITSQNCTFPGTLGPVNLNRPVAGPARRSDGTFTLANCGRVFGFQPPAPQTGQPLFPGYVPDQPPDIP
jgi:hypothetical protein